MAYSSAIKTEAGKNLLARVSAGETTIMISKLAISNTPIESFVAKQELVPAVTKFTRDTKVGALVEGVFSNVSVTVGYDINTIVVYAKDDSDNEIMFSYLTATDNPAYMEAYNGYTPQPININIEAGVSLDDSSMIIVDPSGQATIEYVDDAVDALESKINSVTTVTIPISGWTTNTDDDSTNYYSIDINVTGMTSAYVGTNACDYVRPATYNVAELETIQEMFNLITDIQSNDGYITVYASEIPTTAFQIYLYGVG